MTGRFPRIEVLRKAMLAEQSPPAFLQHASLRPGGYMLIDNINSGGAKVEMDTFTCCHCQRIVVMHPNRKRPRNKCRKCNATTCDSAPCGLECDHWEKKWEQFRPWLLPQQIPDDKAVEWFKPEIVKKTPDIWLPRVLGGKYGYQPV